MTIVLKIGSQSLLSRRRGGLDAVLMAQLIGQIARLKQDGHVVYLLSSGAVAAGRSMWREQGGGAAVRQILAGLGQVELMQHYKQMAQTHQLQGKQLQVVQLLLTKNDFIRRSHYLNLERLLLRMRDFPELLPIINENDSVSVDELMFTDNDELAGLLARQLGADLLVLLTEAAGIYNGNPPKNGEKNGDLRPIPVLRDEQQPWPKLEGKSRSGRGGIGSKLETVRKMSRAGVVSSIAAAREPEIVLQIVEQVLALRTALRETALRDGGANGSAKKLEAESIAARSEPSEPSEPSECWAAAWAMRPQLGTAVLPAPWALAQWAGIGGGIGGMGLHKEPRRAKRGLRKWLVARNMAAGEARIVVHAGLAEKLEGEKQLISILPVGVLRYEGEFRKGDLIDIYSEGGKKLGIGLARYSHMQLAKTMAQKNGAVLIHYNYLHVEKWDS